MKRRFIMLGAILFFILMLLFPGRVFTGASGGLLLWFQTVLPTLLPFIILSNLLIRTHAIDVISRILSPAFSHIFCVSRYGSFAILTGFLCGYPMGGKVTADLLRNGSITAGEGRYLLSFCNNTSPMFIISFVIMQNIKDDSLTLPAILILLGTPLLLSFPFRVYYRRLSRHDALRNKPAAARPIPPSAKSPDPKGGLVDGCIMNGFETITKVGGYIMLFSILLSLTSLLPFHQEIFQLFLLPSLEITNGVAMICKSGASQAVKFIQCMSLTSFGGWCAVAQTKSMIQGTGLPIAPYIIQKLVTALATSLFAYIYIML